jgi:putative holliday junction resolvase
MIVMGLDVGDKRIGVAISDAENILATPLTTIERSADDAVTVQTIIDIVTNRKVERIIAGLPYSLNGTIGPQATRTLSFIEKLSQSTDIPVETRDERMSTVAAQQMLRQSGKNSMQMKGKIDSAAAAYILQGYLDILRMTEQ